MLTKISRLNLPWQALLGSLLVLISLFIIYKFILRSRIICTYIELGIPILISVIVFFWGDGIIKSIKLTLLLRLGISLFILVIVFSTINQLLEVCKMPVPISASPTLMEEEKPIVLPSDIAIQTPQQVAIKMPPPPPSSDYSHQALCGPSRNQLIYELNINGFVHSPRHGYPIHYAQARAGTNETWILVEFDQPAQSLSSIERMTADYAVCQLWMSYYILTPEPNLDLLTPIVCTDPICS